MNFARFSIIVLVVSAIGVAAAAQAAVYKYEAPDGTIHFTNVPTHSGYRPFSMLCSLPLKDYASHIHKAAQRHGLDPKLVQAIIKAESDFQANVVSCKGAVGLMQLMPATSKDMGVSNPYNPKENIEGGTKYLAQLLQRFGKLKLAVAAYNAGPANVEKYGGIPPFKETQTFVARVMDYYGSPK